MASRTIQPFQWFLYSSPVCLNIHKHTQERAGKPTKLPTSIKIWTPSKTIFRGQTQVSLPNGISISPAVFAQFIHVPEKPCIHQQQCRRNVRHCQNTTFDFVAKNGNNVEQVIVKYSPFDKVECCFDIVDVFGNNVEQRFRAISSFRQSRKKLNMHNLF